MASIDASNWRSPAAVRVYRLAAKQGHADAQHNLAVCLRNGYGGVVRDPVEAMRLFRLAAEQGFADSQNNLGNCFNAGEGVARDKVEAVRMYRLAAAQGHMEAQFNLAVCLTFGGEGVAKDLVEAMRFYRLAADQGHVGAQHGIANGLRFGDGVLRDPAEAVLYFRMAVAQGDVRAKLSLGEILIEGTGDGSVPRKQKEGARLIAVAAQQFDTCAAHENRNDALAILAAHAHERDVAKACCIGCGKTKSLKVCSKCRVAKFCGAECMKRMWPVHKPGCLRFASEDAANNASEEEEEEEERARSRVHQMIGESVVAGSSARATSASTGPSPSPGHQRTPV